MSADGYHITLPRPGGAGAARAMENAIRNAGMDPADVDLEKALFVDDSPAVLRAARDAGIAWLYQLTWPDSTRPPVRPAAEFHGVRSLSELAP